jgi:mono/diheme cytochrome c family protein
MSLRVLNGLLVVLLLGGLVMIFVARRDFTRPNLEFAPDMAHGPASGAFNENANFPDGKTLRDPVAGTIPRDAQPLHYAPTTQEAERAGAELSSPFALDDSVAVQRGAFVYTGFCQQCHGPTGLGDGTVARRGFPPPPSLLAERAVQMKDGQMFHIITYGQGNMPGHAGQIGREDRWRAIAYVRSLQAKAAAAASQPAAATQPSGVP